MCLEQAIVFTLKATKLPLKTWRDVTCPSPQEVLFFLGSGDAATAEQQELRDIVHLGASDAKKLGYKNM